MGWEAVKIAADTNVLLRAVLGDEPRQRLIAQAALKDADLVAIPISTLCEFVWVLSQGYKQSNAIIAHALRVLLGGANVVVDRQAVDAGLDILDAGGDFADGVIAFEGRRLGGETFVSFDRQAIRLLKTAGAEVHQL